jgi:archaemetzincin
VIALARMHTEASSNGRTADFGSADEGSNPSASTKHPAGRAANQRAEVKHLPMPQRTLLVALGALPRRLLLDVAQELQVVFGPPAEVGPAQERPEYAFNKDRNQYHSTAILRRLAHTRGEARLEPVIGLTDADLFVPDAPYVFGEADRDANSAVVSIARLQHGPDGRPADPARLARRVAVEAVHELGHLLGLSHCADARCAMYLSHKASDSDRKGPGLCATCRGALGLP